MRFVETNRVVRRPDGAILKGGSLYVTTNELNAIAFAIYEFFKDKE
ncbi:MAG: hypothetical protein LWW85_02350 [Marinilabiliales bacterium]|nr:hypothetical protein [Marinilabiliales bacterium]